MVLSPWLEVVISCALLSPAPGALPKQRHRVEIGNGVVLSRWELARPPSRCLENVMQDLMSQICRIVDDDDNAISHVEPEGGSLGAMQRACHDGPAYRGVVAPHAGAVPPLPINRPPSD